MSNKRVGRSLYSVLRPTRPRLVSVELDGAGVPAVVALAGDLGLDRAVELDGLAAGGVPVLGGVGVHLEQDDAGSVGAVGEPRLDEAVPQLLGLRTVADDG